MLEGLGGGGGGAAAAAAGESWKAEEDRWWCQALKCYWPSRPRGGMLNNISSAGGSIHGIAGNLRGARRRDGRHQALCAIIGCDVGRFGVCLREMRKTWGKVESIGGLEAF